MVELEATEDRYKFKKFGGNKTLGIMHGGSSILSNTWRAT